MSAVSVFPPKKPERMPTVPPMSAEIAAAQKPMSSETLAPAMSSRDHARAAAVGAERELAARRLEHRRRPSPSGRRSIRSGPKTARKTKNAEDADRDQRGLVAQDGRRNRSADFSERVGEARLLDEPTRRAGRDSFGHPRVELEVEEVGEQVEEDHRQREEQERRLQHRVVALVDRLDDQEPDARVREDVLDGDRARR